jgi:hypothetical protein
MPFGFAVVPEVYMMYSGCSASNDSGSCSVDWRSTTSSHHRSRPSVQSTSCSVRFTTITLRTPGLRPTASSTAGLSALGAPRR